MNRRALATGGAVLFFATALLGASVAWAESYTVQAGDTLGGIASQFGVSVNALENTNGITNPNSLQIGQTLTIPGGGTSSTASGGTYTVQSGDTLGGIASNFGISVAALESANGITNPNSLQIGQVLTIPGSGTSSAPAPASSGGTYTVQTGDTLGGIATNFGISVATLESANGITDPNSLQVGQVLTIPGSGTSSAPAPASSGGTYTVQSGDTLGGIATHFGISLAALESANGITDPNSLQVGQSLVIPGESAPALTNRGGVNRQRYVVQAGNTMSGIAAQFGVSLAALESVNGISNPNSLQVGQAIWIPGAGSSPAPASAAATQAAAPATAASATSLGQRMAATAQRFLGVPYVFGGESPAGFDCSGLVQYAAKLNGISVPRSSYSQYTVGTPIAEGALQAGDLVFFDTSGYGASHVGIYVGGGRFISAMTYGQPVQYASIYNSYWAGHYIGARRVS